MVTHTLHTHSLIFDSMMMMMMMTTQPTNIIIINKQQQQQKKKKKLDSILSVLFVYIHSLRNLLCALSVQV